MPLSDTLGVASFTFLTPTGVWARGTMVGHMGYLVLTLDVNGFIIPSPKLSLYIVGDNS